VINTRDISDLVKDKNNKISKLGEFQTIYNPLHFYCRLRDVGIDMEKAKEITTNYEKQIYELISKYFSNKPYNGLD